MDKTKPCTEGGGKHRVNDSDLQEARANPGEDGSYTVQCIDCGKPITKGPTDLTGTAPGGTVAR